MEICDCCGEKVTNICIVKRVIVLNDKEIITFDHMCPRCRLKEYSLKEK